MRSTLAKSIFLHIIASICLITNLRSNSFIMPYISLTNTLYVICRYFIKDQGLMFSMIVNLFVLAYEYLLASIIT